MSGYRGSCLLINYVYALNDPTSRQAAASLAEAGWRVTIFQTTAQGIHSERPPGVETYECARPRIPSVGGPIHRLAKWRSFRRELASWIMKNKPDLVVTIMLHSLSALPKNHGNGHGQLVCCVYDIPSPKDAGRLDSLIFRNAWKRLRQANLVWASDSHKSELAKQFGRLPTRPLVCHNCPPLDYFTGPILPRNGWLRSKLEEEGANVNKTGGCIVIRAGAIGECCGIEETLLALADLPEDVIFLMMGRPTLAYRLGLQHRINVLGLQRRAVIWDRPSDQTWKMALSGADVGHLVHGPFSPGANSRLFALNSSLSNYRLFDYMAMGLPIVAYNDPRLTSLYEEIPCFRNVRLENLVADIQSVLKELSTDSSVRYDLGLAGRNAHLSKYNWEMQFEKVLRSLR